MADWKLICENGWWKTIAENCYTSQFFPIEVRGILAPWLEAPGQECIWKFDSTHQGHIDGFVRQMVDELNLKVLTLPLGNERDFYYKHRMSDFTRHMQGLIHTESHQIFAHMKQALQKEKLEISRLQSCANVSNAGNVTNMQSYGVNTAHKQFSQLDLEVSDILHRVKVSVKEADKQIQNYSTYYANCQSRLYALQVKLQEKSYLEPEEMDEKTRIEAELRASPSKLKEVLSQAEMLMPPLERAYATTTTELQSFKDEQRHVALGKCQERDLDKIDGWYGGVAECFEILQQSLHILHDICQALSPEICSNVKIFFDKITNFRLQMVMLSLVIEIQPSQIIRTETRFGPAKLRVLQCSNNMMVDRTSIQKVLINDVEAGELQGKKMSNSAYIPATAGKLETAKGFPRVEGNQIHFKDFKVTKPTRGTKRGDKSVVEEQFFIFFQVTVNVQGTHYHLWANTLPIIITTHPNQEGDAWATILWDNALPCYQRTPFSQQVPHPQDVSWTNLIALIDLLFAKAGKCLSEDNKEYLKRKLFDGTPSSNDMVSYKHFCKDTFTTVNIKLLGKTPPKSEIIKGANGENYKNFTYWMWIWSFLELLSYTPEDPKLVGNSLKDLWKKDKILGFMSEADIIKNLNRAYDDYPGTRAFLLRFPEGRPESIGMYFFDLVKDVDRSEARKLIKFTYTTKDLDKLSLQDRILKSLRVTHLYPNTRKEDTFKKVDSDKIIDGYLRIGLKEYYSSELLSQLGGLALDNILGVPSPSTSHSFGSYNSRHAPSPSSLTTATVHSENSNGYNSLNGDYTYQTSTGFHPGNFSMTHHGSMDSSSNEELRIQDWVQGVEAAILNGDVLNY